MLENNLVLSDIKKELELKRIEDDELKIVVRYLSDQLIKFEQLKSQKAIGLFSFYAGLLVVAFGLFITVGSYTGYINMGNNYLITYVPIGVGLAGVGYGAIQVKDYKNFLSRNNVDL